MARGLPPGSSWAAHLLPRRGHATAALAAADLAALRADGCGGLALGWWDDAVAGVLRELQASGAAAEVLPAGE